MKKKALFNLINLRIAEAFAAHNTFSFVQNGGGLTEASLFTESAAVSFERKGGNIEFFPNI